MNKITDKFGIRIGFDRLIFFRIRNDIKLYTQLPGWLTLTFLGFYISYWKIK